MRRIQRAWLIPLLCLTIALGACSSQNPPASASTPTQGVATPTLAPFAGTYSKHTKGVVGVAWSPDGKQIASASQDSTVVVWKPG